METEEPKTPILLIHGARVPGIGSFDLPVAGGSLARDLAERDFWSRAADTETLNAELMHAPGKKLLTLSGATHHVHLDRAEHGREQLLKEIIEFCVLRR